MTFAALRDDALSSRVDRVGGADGSDTFNRAGGFELRLGLPWIRSMPLSSIVDLAVRVDNESVPVNLVLGRREVRPADLAHEPGWWFIQDRLVVTGNGTLQPGVHEVVVTFDLVVPYLQAAPGAPLTLPFRLARALTLDAEARPSVSRDVA